jgi:hypothetical protein
MNRFNAPPVGEERSESQERSQKSSLGSTRSEDSTEREKDSQQ